MRVKAASNDWDTLWEDLVQEATTFLGKTTLCHMFITPWRQKFEKKYHTSGAHDPLVMLAVGIEVRLFQWKSGFDESVAGPARKGPTPLGALCEQHPGRTFLLSNEDDRQVIEEFLNSVAARLKAAKLKELKKSLGADDEGE